MGEEPQLECASHVYCRTQTSNVIFYRANSPEVRHVVNLEKNCLFIWTGEKANGSLQHKPVSGMTNIILAGCSKMRAMSTILS